MELTREEFVEKLSGLKKTEAGLLKDLVAFYNKKEPEFAANCQLEEAAIQYERERDKELVKFKNDLRKIDNSIQMFSNTLKRPTSDIVDKLKELMEGIEGQLSAVKQNQKSIYDDLMCMESALSNELLIFDKNMILWEKKSTATRVPRSKIKQGPQSNLHPAVVEFEKYVGDFGIMGGWGEFEQQMFLKNFKANVPDSKLVTGMKRHLPLKTEQDILDHLSWYRKFITLKDAKIRSLAEWKNSKRNVENTKIVVDDHDGTQVKDIENKRKLLADKEREERLGHLNAYKVQKELERVMREEGKLNEQIETNKKEVARKEHERRQREKLKAYKEKKLLEMEMRREEELKQKRVLNAAHKKVSKAELLLLHEKNLEILERKQAEKNAKVLEEFEKAQRLERLKSTVKVNVSSDPSRLFQKTKGQINREKDGSSSGGGVVGARNMPHRAQPAWRKGL